MALFEILPEAIKELDRSSFADLKLRERGDLQRLLRKQISVISPDLYVISEEFSDWEDSYRRIDLLAIDKDANLVVIELKRTQDGGHMDLQAIRYAAMISTMTFDKVARAHDQYLRRLGETNGDAEARILEFLGWSTPQEEEFAKDVRIFLVSEDFGIELTSAVLWLRGRGIDIRCVRLHPYSKGDQIFVDVQQIIPLPEAEEYMIRLRDKQDVSRSSQQGRRDYTRYNVTIAGQLHRNLPKNRAILTVVKGLAASGTAPDAMIETIAQGRRRFYQVPGIHSNQDSFIAAAHTAASDNESRAFDAKRYFTATEELIHHEGLTYAFSNQWGPWTESKMQDLLKAHGPSSASIESVAG